MGLRGIFELIKSCMENKKAEGAINSREGCIQCLGCSGLYKSIITTVEWPFTELQAFPVRRSESIGCVERYLRALIPLLSD
jgi:hypothetical protein